MVITGFWAGKWEDDHIQFDTRELGTFVIQADTYRQGCASSEHSKHQDQGICGDGMSGIDQFKALVNGAMGVVEL
jgi:hypothetical protein